MIKQYPAKTDEDKDAIIEQAKIVCRWMGWIELGISRQPASESIRKLKAMIEESTGAEIEEYT